MTLCHVDMLPLMLAALAAFVTVRVARVALSTGDRRAAMPVAHAVVVGAARRPATLPVGAIPSQRATVAVPAARTVTSPEHVEDWLRVSA